jgi:hypothetical protein
MKRRERRFPEEWHRIARAMAALQGGDKPAQPAEVAATTMKLDQIDGTTKGGRDFMLGDLVRPENVKYLQNGQPVIAPENKVFKVIIDGQTTTVALDGTSTTTPITVEA